MDQEGCGAPERSRSHLARLGPGERRCLVSQHIVMERCWLDPDEKWHAEGVGLRSGTRSHEIPERRRCERIIAQVRSERAAKSLRCAEAVEPR